MTNQKERIKPVFEWVTQQNDESIRYLQHGVPSDLVRWHYHEEYELHYIASTSGKAFVGDYIGSFSPNSLVLVGPNLPHNWISQIDKGQEVALRDRVINFSQEFIDTCNQSFPEMRALSNFWDRSQYGIEFHNQELIYESRDLLEEIAGSTGLHRLTLFWLIIEKLAATKDYRILSTSPYLSHLDKKNLSQLNNAITYILEHYDQKITLEEVALNLKMSVTYFSKFFRKATGNRFVAFVNSLRINKSCELLAHSNEPITEICFMVGFNNIANFNRRFYDSKKMTPSEYRKASLDTLYVESTKK